jgi:hypothetical protein
MDKNFEGKNNNNAENPGSVSEPDNVPKTPEQDNISNRDNASDKDDPDINSFTMDMNGNIKKSTGAAAISHTGAWTFIVLGWICAALTAFVYPLFAIAGIIFGVLANRRAERSGNAVIITNIVVAVAFYLLRFIFSIVLRRVTL